MNTEDLFEKPAGAPFARLQWQGTEACLDLYCACGDGDHLDEWAPFVVKCRNCGRIYALSPYIQMVEVPQQQHEEVKGLIVPFGWDKSWEGTEEKRAAMARPKEKT